MLIGFDLLVPARQYIPEYPIRNDFRLAYAAATVRISSGYGHLYDLAAQKAAIEALGPGFNPQPFISPPPLAWLGTPLSLLPVVAALIISTLLLLPSLCWTSYPR